LDYDYDTVMNAALIGDGEILQCVDDETLLHVEIALKQLYDEYYFDLSRADRDEAVDKLSVQVENIQAERRRRQK
jgi:hypothetical protein